MKKTHKTNASRLLDQANINYRLRAYEVNEEDLSAKHVADTLDEDLARIFKTLVLKGDKTGHFVCVIPADTELDLKKTAKVSGNKKSELIHLKELQPLTGYIRGGCSPIGMKKKFPAYIDEKALKYESIYISAGQRGMQIQLAPCDLIQATQATVADLSEGENKEFL